MQKIEPWPEHAFTISEFTPQDTAIYRELHSQANQSSATLAKPAEYSLGQQPREGTMIAQSNQI